MLKLNASTIFKKDFKLCMKRGYDMDLLKAAVDTLRMPSPLPEKNKNHALSGNWSGFQEGHIQPDWLLIYRVAGDELFLARTGTHSDLFNK